MSFLLDIMPHQKWTAFQEAWHSTSSLVNHSQHFAFKNCQKSAPHLGLTEVHHHSLSFAFEISRPISWTSSLLRKLLRPILACSQDRENLWHRTKNERRSRMYSLRLPWPMIR